MAHDQYAMESDLVGSAPDQALRLSLVGQIDMDAAEKLTDDLLDAVRLTDARRVVVDLDRATFLDSRGISMLVAGFDATRAAGRGFALARAHGVVRRVLEVSGLATLLRPARPAPPAGTPARPPRPAAAPPPPARRGPA